MTLSQDTLASLAAAAKFREAEGATDLERATTALNAARTAHDTLVQDPAATDAEVVHAYHEFSRAQVIYDDALLQDEQAAERENLAAKADRLRELTVPAPSTDGLEVTEIDTIDGWVPEEPSTPPAGSIDSQALRTTAWDRNELNALELRAINERIIELKADADDCGPWNEQFAREALQMAAADDEWVDVIALAVLIHRRAQ